ncbi:DUF2505 domain-containing protein [Piscicoccus intestinalis]|uniref:DUF2505 domain-containing protein n=1 Tax=Piscicoccus intestinalis TaxID=746033 RepID=UPI000837DDDC|nr:DUF2505 domain-containing protein [Piscicoccus intestinalis]
MTTARTLTWTFDDTPEAILRRCGRPEVAQARARADRNLEAEVVELATDTPDGAVLVVAMTGRIPTSWIPSKVTSSMRSAMSGTPGIHRREAWYLDEDGAAYADVDFDLQGVPATTLTGSARLAPTGTTGSGSTLTYQLDLDVEIPFFGSMIEKAVLDQVARAFDKEAHVIRSS